jgi:hypothetical protein
VHTLARWICKLQNLNLRRACRPSLGPIVNTKNNPVKGLQVVVPNYIEEKSRVVNVADEKKSNRHRHRHRRRSGNRIGGRDQNR